MDPIKGIDNLITAFMNLQAYASDWQLVIIGPRNDYRSRLEEVVRNSNGSHSVFFVDPMFGKEKIDAYFSSDVFVVPSLFDAMTIVAVEAAACSIPVLITETSDFKSLYENGGAIQVSPTVEGLELGLLKIFGSKDEELKEMGRKGCEYVSRSLEWRILGEKFNRIFIEAVNPVD
jgi:glycosyltransferase involved in cell wall biosynthesis